MNEKRKGRKPIGDKALTSAEKMRIYRQRLRDGGGKTFAIDISGERMRWITALAETAETTEGEMLRRIVTKAIDWRIELYHKACQLQEAGASQNAVIQFYEDNAFKLTDIDKYLEKDFQHDNTNPL